MLYQLSYTGAGALYIARFLCKEIDTSAAAFSQWILSTDRAIALVHDFSTDALHSARKLCFYTKTKTDQHLACTRQTAPNLALARLLQCHQHSYAQKAWITTGRHKLWITLCASGSQAGE
ncbi:hypothetical protein ULG90_14550 [Halopseudomonas pachastrellae]|nr:hypothetical protein ULG90_14550 [Halopseudomonas pachastrellae]